MAQAFHQDSSPEEIERKFLVEQPPGPLDGFPSERLVQGYLAVAEDGTSVRLRRGAGDPVLTVKRGRGKRRMEQEVTLTEAQWAALWPLTDGTRVEKTRYRIPYGDCTVELDVYAGALGGLLTAEVEFTSEHASEAFRPPPWFGPEVTDDERFKNQHLARFGLPRNAR